MTEKILTKKYIKKIGYDVEEVSDRIFLIKNFLSKKEVDNLLSHAKSTKEEAWTHHYMEGVRDLAKLKFGRDDVDSLVEEGLYQITNNWSDKNLKIVDLDLIKSLDERAQLLFNFRDDLYFNGCGTIQRQYEGVELKEHVDNHTDPSLEYAVVFYLNNDYIDGEVYFVKQKIKLRPEPGSILVFPTGEDWLHGVYAPSAGPHRYVIPAFVSRKDFWQKHKDNNYNVDKTLEDTSYI